VSAPEDPKLDALLEGAAPADAPPGFADRVLAAARLRRRRLLLTRIVVAVAAALAVGASVGLLSRPRGTPPQAPAVAQVEPSGIATPAAEAGGCAVSFAPTEQAQRYTIIGKVNGTLILINRPIGEPQQLAEAPMAMFGSLSPGGEGPSMAVRFPDSTAEE